MCSEHRAHCSQLAVADGTVAHWLQSAWGEGVTLAQMPVQVLGMGAPIPPAQGTEGTIAAHPALNTGCAPTLLPIHHAGNQGLSPFYYHNCIKEQAAASQQASARPLSRGVRNHPCQLLVTTVVQDLHAAVP